MKTNLPPIVVNTTRVRITIWRCANIAPHLVNLDFLRSRATKETLEVLAGETMLCFECGDKLQQRDGELVCRGCGVVWGNGVFEDNKIPFEVANQRRDFEGHWSPPNQLAFNKGMGTNEFISRGSFCRIIAPVNKKDLGVRAIHLKALTSKAEHPWILSLLETGSQICNRFGLHKKDNACVRFSNQYGNVLRKLGAYIIIRGEHLNELKKTARATFVILYGEIAGEEKAEEARRELGVDRGFLGYVCFLVNALTPKRRNAKKKVLRDKI